MGEGEMKEFFVCMVMIIVIVYVIICMTIAELIF